MSYNIPELIESSRQRFSEAHWELVWREGQLELCEDILAQYLEDNVKVVILDAPTGTGKTIIGWIVGDVLNHVNTEEHPLPDGKWQTTFLTSTIALQRQVNELPGVEFLSGASNYSCDTMYELAKNHKYHSCSEISDQFCHYKQARTIFINSQLKSLNYNFFLSAGGMGSGHSANMSLLSIDEAHRLFDVMTDSAGVQWTDEDLDIDQRLGAFLDELIEEHKASLSPDMVVALQTTFKQWEIDDGFYDNPLLHQNWAELSPSQLDDWIPLLYSNAQFNVDALALLKDASTLLIDAGITKFAKSIHGFVSQVSEVWSKLELFARIMNTFKTGDRMKLFIDTSIVIESLDNGGTEIRWVILPREIIQQLLFNGNHRVLMMSGSSYIMKYGLHLQEMRNNGLSIVKLKAPYHWDPKKRPIVVHHMPKLNYGTRDEVMPQYVKRIDDIIKSDQTDLDTGCMIVHTASYANAEYIRDRSKHSHLMIIPKGENLRALSQNAEAGAIYLSPAAIEGVDIGGNLVKSQIIMKLSWPNFGDEVTKKRTELPGFEDWALDLTGTRLIQAAGRGIRSEDDECILHILDPAVNRVLRSKAVTDVGEWFSSTVTYL